MESAFLVLHSRVNHPLNIGFELRDSSIDMLDLAISVSLKRR